MVSEKVRQALAFARRKHEGQQRKHGLDYAFHPEEVAGLLTLRYGVGDDEVICAALLHDVVEETPTQLQEIEERFGGRVASLVAGLTRDKSRPYQEYSQRLASQPPETLLIKGADVLSNLRDSTLADGQTRQRVARRARKYILPLVREKLGSEHLLVHDLQSLLGAMETSIDAAD